MKQAYFVLNTIGTGEPRDLLSPDFGGAFVPVCACSYSGARVIAQVLCEEFDYDLISIAPGAEFIAEFDAPDSLSKVDEARRSLGIPELFFTGRSLAG